MNSKFVFGTFMRNAFAQSTMLSLAAIIVAFAGSSAFAAGSVDPQSTVQIAAHNYIKETGKTEAVTGGMVKSPCASDLDGDLLTVTCSGEWTGFDGGTGPVKNPFKCVGKFVQGENGSYYPQGKVNCNDE